MKISTRRICGAFAAALLAFAPIAANAQAIQYRDSDDKNNVNVSVSNPLPVSGSFTGSSAAVGTNGSANPASSDQIGVSDGTNLQKVIAPIALGDGVNGNNTVSTGGFVWNGTTWDRMPGSTTGIKTTSSDGAISNLGTSTDAASCASGTSILACLRQHHSDLTSSIPAGTAVIGFTTNDPCGQATKLGASINLTASGQVITSTSAKKTYICSIDITSATAQNIALVEGTGSTCATNIFGLAGGTTAATGWNFAANGGLTKGSGVGTVYSPSADTNAAAANVCLLLSSTGQTSGQITYVQQ